MKSTTIKPMTLALQTNRYQTKVPTAITESGLTISVPFYLNPTSDQKKALLNAFRTIKAQQLDDMGYNTERQSNSVVVIDTPPVALTPIEEELGMTEDNLRMALFSRQGLQERLILKLQRLTGLTLFTRDEVRNTF